MRRSSSGLLVATVRHLPAVGAVGLAATLGQAALGADTRDSSGRATVALAASTATVGVSELAEVGLDIGHGSGTASSTTVAALLHDESSRIADDCYPLHQKR